MVNARDFVCIYQSFAFEALCNFGVFCRSSTPTFFTVFFVSEFSIFPISDPLSLSATPSRPFSSLRLFSHFSFSAVPFPDISCSEFDRPSSIKPVFHQNRTAVIIVNPPSSDPFPLSVVVPFSIEPVYVLCPDSDLDHEHNCAILVIYHSVSVPPDLSECSCLMLKF